MHAHSQQYPSGVEQELPAVPTLCQQSNVSLTPHSCPSEVVYSVVSTRGSKGHFSPLVSPKKSTASEADGRLLPQKRQLHRKPSLCVGMLLRGAELLLLLRYFHLLYFLGFITCMSTHSHFALPFHKLSAPFPVLQMGTPMEVTHMEVTQSLPIEEFMFATCLFVKLSARRMFWIVISTPQTAESQER